MVGSKRQQRRSHALRAFTRSLHENEARQKNLKAMIRIAQLFEFNRSASCERRTFFRILDESRHRRVVLALYNQLLTLRTRKHSNA